MIANSGAARCQPPRRALNLHCRASSGTIASRPAGLRSRTPAATTLVPVPMSTQRQLPRRDVLIIFGGLLLVMLLGALDQTIVATALPTIVGELGGVERLAWVVTAYLLAQTVVTPIYGKLGDLYGRKVVLQAAVLIFLAGSA